MNYDYEKYVAECQKIRKQNKKLLNEFASWLRQQNLTKKTVKRHRENIDLFINDFLLYEDTVEAKNGVDKIGVFLGYWFIKKAMRSSEGAIKSSAASLKKFYTFMFEKQEVNKESLEDLKNIIKQEMPKWLETVNRYYDDSIDDMEDVWLI